MGKRKSLNPKEDLRLGAAFRQRKKARKLNNILIAFGILSMLVLFIALHFQSKSYARHGLHGESSANVFKNHSGNKNVDVTNQQAKNLKLMQKVGSETDFIISPKEQASRMEDLLSQAKSHMHEEQLSLPKQNETNPAQAIDKKWSDDPSNSFDTMNPAVIEASSAHTADAAKQFQNAAQIKNPVESNKHY